MRETLGYTCIPRRLFQYFRLILALTAILYVFGYQTRPASAVQTGLIPQSIRSAPNPATLLLPPGGYGLDLGSSTAYVSFGDPDKLNLAQFTVETWFKRTGAGISHTTGWGGIPNAIPLLTHGADEGENSAQDANWLLVIDDNRDVIAADFEDRTTGNNHPVYGTTPISTNTWHHAAATYDGITWRLYLDGSLEASKDVYLPSRYDTSQKPGLGAMLTSTSAAQGHFQGVLDEARVWSVARTQDQIVSDMNRQLTSGTGLAARWSFGEGSGNTVGDSIASPANGTILGSGFSWVDGAPLNLTANHAPAQPILVSPANGATGIATSADLNVAVSDPDLDNLTVTYYGRAVPENSPANFTLAVIPDTQIYTTYANGAIYFNAELQWAVDHRSGENIRFVTQLGDITEQASPTTYENEWITADTAFSKLELATPDDPSDDIPFSLSVGYHDLHGGTMYFENHFGIWRFNGRPYYGGHYGSDNLNSYSLFSAGNINIIVLNLACADNAPATAVLDWADIQLKADPSRRGIVVCHALFDKAIPGQLSSAGLTVYNALKDNPNLFLMLGGHVRGEARRQDTYNGNTIYSLQSDYQDRPNGGDGWLRVMQFQPGSNQIQVKTYSPTRNQYETDADSQFTLPYNMQGNSFQAIGTNTGVPSGSNTSFPWQNLAPGTTYEWYVTLSDGRATTIGPTWSFTTGSAGSAPVVTMHPANQTVVEGSQATFSAAASGTPAPTVQWQVNPGSSWANIPGATYTSLSFTAQASDNGRQYRAVFTNSYGSATSNAATLTVTPANHPPVAQDQSVSTGEDTYKAITLAATDADGDALTYRVVSTPGHGTLSGTAPNVTYTPNANYNGSDSFTFKANDGIADSNIATVSITVTPVNDPPVCPPASLTTPEDTAKSITLSCTDVESDPLTYHIVTPPSNGTASLPGATLTYTPNANFFGPDGLSFKANDGQADSTVSTVNVSVTPVNDPPVCQNVSIITSEDATGETATYCADMDSGSLTYAVVTQPTHGAAEVVGGTLRYTPAANYNGSDSFTYRANDSQADSNTATVNTSISPVNDPPVTANNSYATSRDQVLIIAAPGVLANDSDVDGDTLTAGVNTTPVHGTLNLSSNGSFTYTPSAGYSGSDSFTYTANDGQGGSATATVTITVNSTNHPPVAQDQSVMTDEDTWKAIVLQATDADGDPLTYSIVNPPAHGTLSGVAPNLTYNPNENYNGSDSFTYKANDGAMDSNTATIRITVLPVNDPPVATGQSVSTGAGIPINITLRATDMENDPLIYSIVAPPSHGSLSGAGPNLTYTPSAGYSGADGFTFVANDGQANSNAATVNIMVTGDAIFADDFDSGNADSWSGSYGTIGFSDQVTADGSPWSMAINIVSNASAYVIDQSPSAEGHYNVRFYLNPGSISIAKSDVITIFSANNQAGNPAAIVQLRLANGNYQVRAGISADNKRFTYTPWQTLNVDWNSIEFHWLAADTAGVHNGSLTFWLDGVQKSSLNRIDNDGQRVESAYLGAISRPATGTRGAFYFDEFESRRSTY